MARTTIKTIVDNQPIINHGGYFTELMASFNRYIGEEYKQNRLTGAQYAQVYLGGMQAVLAAALDYAKHGDQIDVQDNQLAKQDQWKQAELALQEMVELERIRIQDEKLALERELNKTQQQLVRAQTQAFKARHNKDLAKLVFDVVTIGVTQEQMNILAGPNPIFGTLKPADAYAEAAWTDIP